MRISIITVVFNNRDGVTDAMESVARQSYPDIEHIVVDGGSTDGTLEAIRAHATRNVRVISEPDEGIYDALNKGIGLATGDAIGVLHSDDVFDSDRVIEDVAGAFERSGCDAVYGDIVFTSRNNIGRIVRRWKSRGFDARRFRRGWMPPHTALFVRWRVYAEGGLYDTRYSVAADYDFMLRTLATGSLRCEHVPLVITRMRVGGTSTGGLRNIIRKSWEDMRILRSHGYCALPVVIAKNFSKLGQLVAPARAGIRGGPP